MTDTKIHQMISTAQKNQDREPTEMMSKQKLLCSWQMISEEVSLNL